MTDRICPTWAPPSPEQRFWAKVDRTGDCWLWSAALNASGYGIAWSPGARKTGLAHRIAYELLVGPISNGMQIDHLCRVRNCVRPDHMELVTTGENTRRGLRGRMVTHCPQGHPYDDKNTRIYEGQRKCRACDNARRRERHARAKAAAAAVVSTPEQSP